MPYDYDIAVIGAGSGGLVVAAGSAALGARVLLAEAERMGGDCLNYGCVPSKSFLKGAHLGAHIKEGVAFGLRCSMPDFDVAQLTAYVEKVIADIAPHDSQERFEGLGVTVLRKRATVESAHSINVDGKSYTARSIVIATGSDARVPPLIADAGVPYYTNRTIFGIKVLPRSMLVIGAGPIGLEIGQGFAHLGCKVTVSDRNKTLFRKDEPEVASIMLEALKEDGINFALSSTVQAVQKSEQGINITLETDGVKSTDYYDAILVSAGREPSTSGLNLESVGVATDKRGFITVDKNLRTSVKSIFACGDACGPYLFTHMAGYQAGVVIQNALFGLNVTTNYNNISWCTYTKPEVAHVGLMHEQALNADPGAQAINIPLAQNDRARAENDLKGFLKISTDRKGRVLGATVVGDKAGELIGIAALAVTAKLNISTFNSVIFPYPTQAEIYKAAASAYRKQHAKQWQLNLLKSIINMRAK